MRDFLTWDATEILAALRAGTFSATDLMQATLDHIAAVNPALNAIVSLRDADDLMAAARAADSGAAKGALHGLPIAIKDLANVAGLPTSQGSPLFAGQIAPENDLMVQRILNAGAIVIGKTNTPEFGLGSHTYNPVFGPTQNALRPGCSAGGSSGGAAVALAARMVSLADGSDMMGSLRNPAGWNGVYGMRPSWGRVPAEPHGDIFLHPLATNGPMARSPRDIALLLDVQTGPDPRVPSGFSPMAMSDHLDADLRGRRIGWLADWGGAYPMAQGVLEACGSAVKTFADLGCTVQQIEAPFPADLLWQAWTDLRSWAIAANLGEIYDQPSKRAYLKPEAIWEVERGRNLSLNDVQVASAIRSDWFRTAAVLFERFDALALPTAQCWPFGVHLDWPKEIAGIEMDTYHRWMEVVIPVSLIGLPCLAVPLQDGSPMGLQVIGRYGDDRGILQLGQGWHHHMERTMR